MQNLKRGKLRMFTKKSQKRMFTHQALYERKTRRRASSCVCESIGFTLRITVDPAASTTLFVAIEITTIYLKSNSITIIDLLKIPDRFDFLRTVYRES